MQLDGPTVLAVGGMVIAMLATIMVYFYLQDRNARWLGLWAMPFAVGIVAVLVYSQRGIAPDFVSRGIGTALILLVYCLIWQAFRAFDGRKLLLWPAWLITGGWLALSLWPPFMEALPIRILVVSLMLSLLCGICAWELWRGRAEALPSRGAAVAVLVIFTIGQLGRIALIPVAPFPLGALPPQGWAIAVAFGGSAVAAIFVSILVISMTKERRELAQRNIAITDPLTGLLNRRAFSDQALARSSVPERARPVVSLLVLDLDRFKTINDTHGHEVGDRVLRAFADVMRMSVRAQDQVFRLGGEEFCMILPGVDAGEAVATAERIRRAFALSFVVAEASDIRATVSIGVASSEAGSQLDALLAAADTALYEAKRGGRNKVMLSTGRATLALVEPAPDSERRTA